jgi:hypothetical protein
MNKKEHITLLNKVFDHLQQITQWVPDNLTVASEYNNKALAIIEILEQDIFGNYRGSFKRGHVHKYELTGSSNFDRFYYMVKELKCEKQIKKVCYFDVENMHQYFKQLNELRETFNK